MTKWPEVSAVKDRTAPTVAKCLAELVWRHGVPTKIIHDRAVEFLSDVLQDTAAIFGLRQLPTSGGHPQTNGLVERFNRTLKNLLTKLVEARGKNWDRVLSPVYWRIIPPHILQVVRCHFSLCMDVTANYQPAWISMYLLLVYRRLQRTMLENCLLSLKQQDN